MCGGGKGVKEIDIGVVEDRHALGLWRTVTHWGVEDRHALGCGGPSRIGVWRTVTHWVVEDRHALGCGGPSLLFTVIGLECFCKCLNTKIEKKKKKKKKGLVGKVYLQHSLQVNLQAS